jgi:hypothetical protein
VRRLLLGAVVVSLVVAVLAMEARSRETQPGLVPLPRTLEILVGPVTVLGSDPACAAFDAAQLDGGRRFAEKFPAHPADLIASTYYDLALVLYTIHYRTGDAFWKERARVVATRWRDAPENTVIGAFLADEPGAAARVPPPRGLASLGLAVLAVENGDKTARSVVDGHARMIERLMTRAGRYGLANPSMPLGDAREAGYALTALVAATVLGDDHRKAAAQLLDAILERQRPDGQWLSSAESISTPFTLNYMNGLLMESLVLYDRAIGDARIVPALTRALAWTWTTQWRASAGAFQYGSVDEGTVNTKPAPVLNGLMLPAWGYVATRTGDREIRAQGRRIFDGAVRAGLGEIYAVKQFDQLFRSSPRYLGFDARFGGVSGSVRGFLGRAWGGFVTRSTPTTRLASFPAHLRAATAMRDAEVHGTTVAPTSATSYRRHVGVIREGSSAP